jgi:hypothetical protein
VKCFCANSADLDVNSASSIILTEKFPMKIIAGGSEKSLYVKRKWISNFISRRKCNYVNGN